MMKTLPGELVQKFEQFEVMTETGAYGPQLMTEFALRQSAKCELKDALVAVAGVGVAFHHLQAQVQEKLGEASPAKLAQVWMLYDEVMDLIVQNMLECDCRG